MSKLDESGLLTEINKVRTNPHHYIDLIKKYKDYFVSDTIMKIPDRPASIQFREGKSAYEECALFLRSQVPLASLTESNVLKQSAHNFFDKMKDADPSKLAEIDLGQIISEYGKFGGLMKRTMQYGGMTNEEVILNLLVCDGDKSRGQRNAIFNKEVKKVGIACGEHSKYRALTVMIMASQVYDKDGKEE